MPPGFYFDVCMLHFLNNYSLYPPNMFRYDELEFISCSYHVLYLNFLRSVAHYNLEDGTILETTSNPFWATCLFIKHCEAEDEKRKNPDNPDVQNWTNKSLARKRTLLSVLFNSKKCVDFNNHGQFSLRLILWC